MKYISKAHFVYDDNSKDIVDKVCKNKFSTEITPIHIDEFTNNIIALADDIKHVVFSIDGNRFPDLLAIAYICDISIGFIPLPSQKDQIKNLYTISNIDTNIEIALRDNSKPIDLVKINDKFIYNQGIIGTLPFIGTSGKKTKTSLSTSILYAFRKFFSLKIQKFEITTHNGQKIVTAGSALVILNHTTKGFISKLLNVEQSMCDGKVTAVIISPSSVFEYIQFLISVFTFSNNKKTLPKSVGYIQSKSLKIEASISKRIVFEIAESMLLPIECKVKENALKLNASDEFWKKNEDKRTDKETIKTANLPDKAEANKYMSKHIPFFKYASEERFKDLFQILRVDAKLNNTFLALMILSTILATLGLFADSTAVIIGAMLVAPLMTPIVSISMGLLRGDTKMIKDSIFKIVIGIVVALIASSVLAYLLPYSQITQEMQTRINPTLLDLGIAILSGIVAAYSKSFKEIIQNLAGVAIAVALVPPLAVAGIGIGYGEAGLFIGAFLLFFTNLVGIIIAAVVTFNMLGFSSVVKSKKSVAFIFALLLGISYPLYISYDNMIERYKISIMLKQHRFIVNNKYIIVDNANIFIHGDLKILNLDLLVRESLDRDDLEALKSDIQRLFNTKLFISAQMEYIL